VSVEILGATTTKAAAVCSASVFQLDKPMMSEDPSSNLGDRRARNPLYIDVNGCTVTLKQPWARTDVHRFCPRNG
jgi:hypothetical protein